VATHDRRSGVTVPANVSRQRRRYLAASLRRTLPVLLLVAAVFVLALAALRARLAWFPNERRPIVLLALGAAYCGLGLLALVAGVGEALRARPRIVPYFKRPLGAASAAAAAFAGGHGLLRDLTQLDARAISKGASPLSTFGFEDELLGQTAIWHPASDIRRTVEVLCEGQPAVTEDDVVQELEALRAALRAAEEEGVEVCLLLRFWEEGGPELARERGAREGWLC
jgi:hypothetical protein